MYVGGGINSQLINWVFLHRSPGMLIFYSICPFISLDFALMFQIWVQLLGVWMTFFTSLVCFPAIQADIQPSDISNPVIPGEWKGHLSACHHHLLPLIS